ncbi:MAG: hypothetical protein AAF449_20890 [Myxococcota bacterium]
MNDAFTRNAADTRIGALALVGALLTGLAGCSDEAENGSMAACSQDDEIRTVQVPEVPQQGSVTIRDVFDTSLDEAQNPRDLQQSRIQAAFGTVTATAGDPALIDLGRNCVGVVSRPQLGMTTIEAAGELNISGLAEGPVTVEPNANQVYSRVGTPQFSGADDQLMIAAAGDAFDAFSTSIPVVDPLQLMAPGVDGTARLETGELRFQWNGANADYVELRLAPITDDPLVSGGQVICQVADDGCFDLPASATSFLLSSNTTTFSMSVQRTNVQLLMPDADTAIRVVVVSEVRATLLNGVGQ